MTAEIAIANASAVAVAADSAVTIGSGKKIYNSAIKLFALSKFAPVGVMIYGNAGLLGVPWETMIKMYRAQLGRTRFSHLEEYGSSLLKYLASQRAFFPAPLRESWMESNVHGYFTLIRNDLFKKVEQFLRDHGGITDAQTSAILKDCINARHSQLRSLPFSPGFGPATERQLRKRLYATSRAQVRSIFQGAIPPRGAVAALYDIAALLHTRAIYATGTSGIVVVGFGDADIYPVISTYEIEGVVDTKLKYRPRPDKSSRIETAAQCTIIPFAQEDMVATFMQGMNPSVAQFVSEYLLRLMARMPELIDDNYLRGSTAEKQAVKNGLAQSAHSLAVEFLDQLKEHAQATHVQPVLSMVRVLPKDELAAMAESLVNLTAFKRRMTEELETVGGPIDVAVISKGDGLVWVKRKHYFPSALNQHFFSNYSGDGRNEAQD